MVPRKAVRMAEQLNCVCECLMAGIRTIFSRLILHNADPVALDLVGRLRKIGGL